ncbi:MULTISPECIES: ComEA family DNA-binding protein [unclassified Frankia]|uniref:ComEA family DNA-binding protein n=1 Tax=unclassified Frankia TaxID=2632575 RepID=UPI002AD206D9|nr:MULTISPECIES: ComEA family DNA-binding protein [unclassified Frankia]
MGDPGFPAAQGGHTDASQPAAGVSEVLEPQPVMFDVAAPSTPSGALAGEHNEGDLFDELSPQGTAGRLVRQPAARSGPLGLAEHLPRLLRGGLVDPAIRGALLLVVVALAAALTAGWFAWRNRPVSLMAVSAGTPSARAQGHVPADADSAGSKPVIWSSAGATHSPAAQIVVEVVGKVHSPGVLTVAAGSRVADALAQAGGVLPGTDTAGLALARRLVDGEQIMVDGRPGPAPPAPAGAGTGGGTGGGTGSSAITPETPLNLNTATVDALDGLPGVGPVLAQRIVEWRKAHGTFTSPHQLGDVTGVGDRRLTDLLPLITV